MLTWKEMLTLEITLGPGCCRLNTTTTTTTTTTTNPSRTRFLIAPASKTEDHFLVSEVGDWHVDTTSPHRLDQMSISPFPLSGTKNILALNEELSILECVVLVHLSPPSCWVCWHPFDCHSWLWSQPFHPFHSQPSFQLFPWVYVSGFFLAGVLILNLCVYPKLASGAMCMEVSSVFLSTYLGDTEKCGKSALSRKASGRPC